MNQHLDKLKELQKTHINMDKFLFFKAVDKIDNTAFFKKLNLQHGCLIVSILNLFIGLTQFVDALYKGRVMIFLCFVPPSLLLVAGSVLIMLSLTTLDGKNSYWGYILTAGYFYVEIAFSLFLFIVGILFDRTLFGHSVVSNGFWFLLTLALQIYFSWIEFCYAKNVTSGRIDIVEGNVDRILDEERSMTGGYNNNNNDPAIAR